MRPASLGRATLLAAAIASGPASALEPVATPAVLDDALPTGDGPSAEAARSLARAARRCLAGQGRMLGRAVRQGFDLDGDGPAILSKARWNHSYVIQGIDERKASLADERDGLPYMPDAAPERAALLKACLRWSETSVAVLRRMVGGWRDPGLAGRLRKVRDAAGEDYAALRALSEGKADLVPAALDAMGTNRAAGR